ncbi:cyclic AMP-dependent transcription factor ATF-6 alpha [Exaiptasia diaphana]|nr:cyclic AMP-dependent transcription factor ATF-6 alpha [Exaiptasia diaphana]
MFSEAINRQDDTMYIVSFRQDHLVFPATKSNVTQRPKVSLMMMAPSNDTTVNVTKGEESISMIQIDCQVMDTKHINIKKSSLPSPFVDSSYRPSSSNGYTQPSGGHTPSIPTRNAK